MQEPADHAAAEPWTWDPSLYAGTARYYAVGRVAYPAEADAPAAQVPLDGSGVLLDLGCGPGSMTLLLAPYVDRAVGVDPDPEMLAEAARQARRLGIGNVGWRQLRAEDLPADLAPPRLVFSRSPSTGWTGPASPVWSAGCWSPGAPSCTSGRPHHEGVDADQPLPYPRPPRGEIASTAVVSTAVASTAVVSMAVGEHRVTGGTG